MPPTKPSTLHPNPYHSAWLHNPTLSVWLSVDPLSDKYPGVSPYTYCGNNPVRLVDVDGREMADFFDMNGRYLGTDGIDDGKIFLVNDSDWEEAQKCSWINDRGERVPNDAFFFVARLTEIMAHSPSSTNLSDIAIFNIISHYNETGLPTVASHSERGYLCTEISSLKGPLRIHVCIEQWRYSKDIQGRVLGRNQDLNDYYAIKSSFDNEQGHINHCKMIGLQKYTVLSDCEREKYAVGYQKSQPNYQKANMPYQNGIQFYLEKMCN